MARTGITFEQVAAAADALAGAGRQATIQAVREALGTGSPNTIHKHLSVWRQARPVAQSAVLELPAELAAAFGRELARAASAARGEVEGELVQAQAEAVELASTGEALEIERESLAEQVTALTTERDQHQATALERAQEIERLGQAVQREQQGTESARVELARAQLTIDNGTKHLDSMEKEIERLRGQLEAAQTGRQAAEQQAAVAAAQLVAEQSKSTDLAQRLKASEKATADALKAADSARDDAHKSKIAEQTAINRADAAVRDAEKAGEKVASLQKTLEEAQGAAFPKE